MSSGSYFLILRHVNVAAEVKNKISIDSFVERYKKRILSNTGNVEEYFKLPLNEKFEDIWMPKNTFKWVSTKSYKVYDELGKYDFISGFTALKEYYNLGSYNNNELIISLNTAKEMKIAIDYILSRDYSLKTEDLLDNSFIRVFGEQLPSYENFIYKHTPENEVNYGDCFETEGWYFLMKTQAVLSTFIWLCHENDFDEAEYQLVYHAL